MMIYHNFFMCLVCHCYFSFLLLSWYNYNNKLTKPSKNPLFCTYCTFIYIAQLWINCTQKTIIKFGYGP